MGNVLTRAQAPNLPARPAAKLSDGRKAAIAAGAAVLLWSSAFVVIRDIGPTLSAAPLALIRLAVAAVALTGLVAVTKRPATRVPRSWRSAGLIAAYGVVWLAGYTVALNAGERHIDAGTAALLVNLAPLMIAFAAGRLLGEGYPRPLIIGSLIALGGVAVIAMDSSSGSDGVGVVLCVLAAVLYTVGMLIQKVTLHSVDGPTATWLGCLVGTIALLPWTPQLIDELRNASAGTVAGAIYLGLFPTAIGFVAWAYALRRTEVGRLSATSYAVPAMSVLMSWLLLAETPTVFGLAGGAICLLGVAISRRRASPLSGGGSPASGA